MGFFGGGGGGGVLEIADFFFGGGGVNGRAEKMRVPPLGSVVPSCLNSKLSEAEWLS